jgi:hypothetical protein
MLNSAPLWDELFFTDEHESRIVTLRARLLKKQGRPFLLLPMASPSAAKCLDLYPAQTFQARLLKRLVKLLLSSGLPSGTTPIALKLGDNNPFAAFLSQLANSGELNRLEFGILAGNPSTPGRRFIVLTFDSAHRPGAVIKAAANCEAKLLLRKEWDFLSAVGGRLPGIPRLVRTFEGQRVLAIALEYLDGDSPRFSDSHKALETLSAWVDTERRVRLGDTLIWKQLQESASDNPLFAGERAKLAEMNVAQLCYHGDFAPWNIKVSKEGKWTALDWERGELVGVPAWDWFHFLTQPAILVKHLPTNRVAQSLQNSLAEPAFQNYCMRTGISGIERDLLLAYLLYIVFVIKPSEGLRANQELLTAWAAL